MIAAMGAHRPPGDHRREVYRQRGRAASGRGRRARHPPGV